MEILDEGIKCMWTINIPQTKGVLFNFWKLVNRTISRGILTSSTSRTNEDP